jgi:hypothetical protein
VVPPGHTVQHPVDGGLVQDLALLQPAIVAQFPLLTIPRPHPCPLQLHRAAAEHHVPTLVLVARGPTLHLVLPLGSYDFLNLCSEHLLRDDHGRCQPHGRPPLPQRPRQFRDLHAELPWQNPLLEPLLLLVPLTPVAPLLSIAPRV